MNEMAELIKTKEYDFLRDNPHLGNRIALLTIGGSRAYGTNIPTSDVDLRGFSLEFPNEIIGMHKYEHFVSTEFDTTIFGFNTFVNLLLSNNPAVLEILGTTDEEILQINSVGKLVKDNTKIFLHQKAKYSFGEYARMQLHRLENTLAQNNDNVSEKQAFLASKLNKKIQKLTEGMEDGRLAISANEEKLFVDLSMKQYPLDDFLIMSKELEKIYSSFTKNNHRNKKKDDLHLNKHAMHLVRLLITGAELLSTGEIVAKRTKEHNLLMSIRNGDYQNENGGFKTEFFEMVDKLFAEFEYACEHTVLPANPNMDSIEALKMDVNMRILQGKF